MFIKRLLSLLKSHKRLYPFKEKLVAFFVFACMSVNGFIPRSVEISKYSFVMVMASVTQNAALKVFTECGQSLALISNKVSMEILKFLSAGELENDAFARKTEKKTNDTFADKALVVRQTLIEEIKRVKDSKDSDILSFIFCVKLYELYCKYKIPERESGEYVFFLTLLLLIIYIARKKDYYETIIRFFAALKERKISA